MNKFGLLATSAFCAVGLAPLAVQAADPLKLSLGGFAEYYMVARVQKPLNKSVTTLGFPPDNQQKPRGFQTYWEDAEIWFSASTQLDNGVTVAYRMEMETRNVDESRGQSIDPSVGFVVRNSTTDRTHFRDQHQISFTGGFGRFELGDTDGAANSMQYSSPWVTKIGVVDGTDLLMSPSLIFPAASFGVSGSGESINVGNNASIGTKTGEFNRNNRINYFTPRFEPGFQFGVSYAPENGSTGRGAGGPDGNAGPVQTEEDDSDFQNITELGVNFVRSMNGIDVAWSLTGVYAQLEECTKISIPGTGYQGCASVLPNVDRYIVHNGFQLSFAGWTIGAGASVDNRGFKDGQGLAWEGNAGVTYAVGPWAVGIQGGYGETKNDYFQTNDPPVFDAFSGVDTKAAVALGGSYTLGPGIQLQAELQYINWDRRGIESPTLTLLPGFAEELETHKHSQGLAFAFGTAISF